ncbi:hypothetical protein, partial [Burkholderia gladioli]
GLLCRDTLAWRCERPLTRFAPIQTNPICDVAIGPLTPRNGTLRMTNGFHRAQSVTAAPQPEPFPIPFDRVLGLISRMLLHDRAS